MSAGGAAHEGDVARVFAGGPPVGVQDVVARRDTRAARQQDLCVAHPGWVVVATKLNMPGPVKDSPVIRDAFSVIVKDLVHALKRLGAVLDAGGFSGSAGPEAFHLVEAAPDAVKRTLMHVEQTAPWGRVIDADVWWEPAPGQPVQTVSRTELGAAPRECFVCGRPARGCARSRRHSLAELRRAAGQFVWAAYGVHDSCR